MSRAGAPALFLRHARLPTQPPPVVERGLAEQRLVCPDRHQTRGLPVPRPIGYQRHRDPIWRSLLRA
jgi:hypothetical protein